TERGKLSLKFIGCIPPNIQPLGQRERRGREFIELRALAREVGTGHPQPRYELRQVRLRHIQRTRGHSLGQARFLGALAEAPPKLLDIAQIVAAACRRNGRKTYRDLPSRDG